MIEYLVKLLDVPDITTPNDANLVFLLLTLFIICGIIGILKIPFIGVLSGFMLILFSAWIGYNPTLIIARNYTGSEWVSSSIIFPFYPYSNIGLIILAITFIIFGYLDMGGIT